MNNAEIIEQIITFLKQQEICSDDIGVDSLLKQDLGFDSLSLVAVIIGLEDKFGIRFEENDLNPALINTVSDLINLVGKYF